MRRTGHARLVVDLRSLTRRLPLLPPSCQLAPELINSGLVRCIDRDERAGVAIDALSIPQELLDRAVRGMKCQLGQNAEVVGDWGREKSAE
jgi:hypothetical protein